MRITHLPGGLTALAGLSLLAACAPEFEGRLYMQDVLDVAETGETVIVPAQLRIPEGSEKSCTDGLERLAGKLGDLTPLTDQGTCVEIDNSFFSQFTVDLPMVRNGVVPEQTYLAIVTVEPTAEGTGYGLNFRLTSTLAEVQTAIGRGENTSFDLAWNADEQPKFTFTFENDGRDPATLTPNFVFVDDKPGLPDATHSVALDRRQSVIIRFSDVVAAHVSGANDFTFATVRVN